jgi:DNA-binding Lrp family transcriptional regulator
MDSYVQITRTGAGPDGAEFAMPHIDAIDRRLIRATQEGLPLSAQPYHQLAAMLHLSPEEVMTRLRRMLATGIIRRIGAVPNHYSLGYRANGMSVWDVADDDVAEAGSEVGALDFVSHCYHRPRHPPLWPYNLFAMVHGRDREEVEGKVAQIAKLLGAREIGHAVLYSTRILKKTGLRLTR